MVRSDIETPHPKSLSPTVGRGTSFLPPHRWGGQGWGSPNIALSLFTFLLLSLSLTRYCQAQTCAATDFNFSPSTQNRSIDWQKFPEFSLPFTLIYGGPRFGDTQQQPLKHGFSQLAVLEGADNGLMQSQKAHVWYGVAYTGTGQPWETLKSPWGNDMGLYRAKWQHELSTMPDAGILVPDIERQLKSNDSILILKNHQGTPVAYRNLDDNSFIAQYKKDLLALYAEAFRFTNSIRPVQVGGYSDSPVLNTYINIAGNSWQKWTTDPGLLNYLFYNSGTGTIGGEVFNQQSFFAPSAYYYYDYPHPLAPDYLSYLLFQIEVNRAWAPQKNIIPFVWLRYSYVTDAARKFIKPFMAEATAIFPFFSGANGLWLWEDPTFFNNDESFSTYEYFIRGLYRLSQYKSMFTGAYQLVIPQPAHAYVDNRKPIWRGVAKGTDFLVAAHNPFAKDENEVVVVEATHNNWKVNVLLKGYEVFLCKFDMTVLGEEPTRSLTSFRVFPNPSQDQLHIGLDSPTQQTVNLGIFDMQGKAVHQEPISLQAGENRQTINIDRLPAGAYILRALNYVQKFVKE